MGKVELFETVNSLREKLQQFKPNHSIGFVPTMGALHEGHMSLVQESMKECDLTVISIFVNPTQFNNSGDLVNYPRTLESDLELLGKQGDCIVFFPSVEEVYPDNLESETVELGDLGTVMEGRFRPGHFDGVVQVVKRFFDIVEPNSAYFGQKDFQQLAVIRFMTNYFKLPISVVGCETYRERSGLASSSRNLRLSESQKEDAVIIIEMLRFAKDKAGKMSIGEVISHVKNSFENSPLELEYFQIVNSENLQDLNEWEPGARACIAAFCGPVRLIDNLQVL